MNEIWKPIPGFEGVYSASSLGRIRRDQGLTSNGRSWRGKVLKPRYTQDGYVKYTLYREGKPCYLVGHRLVCLAFHGSAPAGKPLVLHKDDNPANNTPENLYWGDGFDNQRDVVKNGNNFGRNKTHCVNGHEYTEANTYRNPKTGNRSCNICRYEHTRNSYRRRKQQ